MTSPLTASRAIGDCPGGWGCAFGPVSSLALLVVWQGAALAACPSGRWLLDAGPAVGGLTVEGRDVSSDECGGAVERVRTLKRAIRIRARWKRCGLLGPVRLTMRIDRTTDAGQGTMILLGFGGLCWDANTCWVDPTSVEP